MPQQQQYHELSRQLDPEKFLNTAREKTGLSDFGSNQFQDAMRKFLDCAAQDVNFHAKGLEIFKADIERILINRLRMENDLKLHPEILDEDVSDPIIVIGLARSGTTKLQKMLSSPDNVHKVSLWRTWNPARFPNAIPGKPDPRIAAADFSQLSSSESEIINSAHHMESEEAEEDWILHMYGFHDWIWNQFVPVSSFFDWVMSRPSVESFRYVKTIMQYLQWQNGGKAGKPWVMKGVGYIANMDALLDCYPNSTLVQTHRDPRDTIPSFAKFVGEGMWSLYAEKVSQQFIGAETQRTWQVAVERYLEARDRLKLDDRILDIQYEQIRNDPMSAIREIFKRTKYKLTPEAEQKMANWHDTNEQGRYGRHEYTLEQYGLSDASIEKAFGEYSKRFINC